MGLLSQVEVIECSASDLIGQYVGHTGPKVIKQLEKGLGKVLFIDEAYRLGESHFAQEAVNELVDCVTKPKYLGKMVIILAGYDKDMDKLLLVNEGLSSRFADELIFSALSPENCLILLRSRLEQSQIAMLSLASTAAHNELLGLMTELSELPAWGSARDVQTLAKSMVRSVYQNNTSKVSQLFISHDIALRCVQDMLSERRARSRTASLPTIPTTMLSGQPASIHATPQSPLSHSNSRSSTLSTAPTATGNTVNKRPPNTPPPVHPTRDAGVSDADWEQFQQDQRMAEVEAQTTEQGFRERAGKYKLAKEAEKQAKSDVAALEVEHIKHEHELSLMRQRGEAKIREIMGMDEDSQRQRDKIAAKLREAQSEEEARSLELMRRREEARIRSAKEREHRERAQREMERQREIDEQRRKKEQQAQVKLREMGVCVQGFVWKKQHGGYRCAGGSHYVSNTALGL